MRADGIDELFDYSLPCGLNGAVYFSQMDADGGMARFPTNTAGAKYGTGYCDSQVRMIS